MKIKTRITISYSTFYILPTISIQRYIQTLSFSCGIYSFQISYTNFGEI